LGEADAPPAVLVFSCLRDKPVAEMAQILFPLFDQVIFAPIASARATPTADLLAAAESVGVPARAAASVAQALDLALAYPASETDVAQAAHPIRGAEGRETPSARAASTAVVVAGSVYLVGEARPLLLALAPAQPSPQPSPQMSTKQ
jgi:dihydrofolate synthase/folylpolyglutamate synthase